MKRLRLTSTAWFKLAARRWSVLALLLALPSACGSRGALDGRFVIEPAPSRGDFANASPFVRKADAQITALVGHPVSFHFDASLVPRWDAQLEALSAAAIDAVAHDLAEMKRLTPEIFAWMTPSFRRVEWDYSATAEHAHYEFDPRAQTLRIVLTSSECCLVHEDFIRFAVGRAHAAAQSGRFGGATAGSVATSDRAAYASWLLGPAYSEETKAHPPKGDDETVDRPRAHVLLELLRFQETVRGQDRALDAKLVERLVEAASYVARIRRQNPELVARLPRDHEFLRAEAAYVAWLGPIEPTLPERSRVQIAEEIVTSTNDDGSVSAFLGFDFVSYYLRVLDAWASAGAPAKHARDEDRVRQELFELIVGPVAFWNADGMGCSGTKSPLYKRLVTDLAARRRIFDAVLAKHDERVTRTMMARLLLVDVDTALAFWRATEPDEAAFRTTTRIIAANVRCSAKIRVFYDVLPELWKKYPARRGLIAYTARKFRSVVGDGDGSGFVRVFAPLTQAELAATLAEEEEPLRELPYLWITLGKGWSRMDVLEPRLDGWLQGDRTRSDTSWTQSIRSVAKELCTEKANADLARLHTWIDHRVAAHASERGVLEPAATLSAPGGCPKQQARFD